MKMSYNLTKLNSTLPFAALTLLILNAHAQDTQNVTITIDAQSPLRTFDHRMLLGSNIAMWLGKTTFEDSTLKKYVIDFAPGIMRMPGGSWSDTVFWNGNGVRRADGSVDITKIKGDYPDIDYSGYAPSILWDGSKHKLSADWNGNVDVKTEHEYIKSLPNTQTLVTVNAGTGRPLDAAEWVKWANGKQHYGVKYWEVGNELDGGWEAGHFLADGSPLTPAMYADRYKAFAQAIKTADPHALVGGAASGSDSGGFAETMLKQAGNLVDFVSIHTYPLQPGMTEEAMIARAHGLSPAVQNVRGWIQKYQPDRASKIPLGITEWNLSVGRTYADFFSGLWALYFLNEMTTSGVDFANEWDLFTSMNPKGEGGSLFSGAKDQPNSFYWAFWFWSKYTGDTLVPSSVASAPKDFLSLSTRSKDALYVMLINPSHETTVAAALTINGFSPAARGETGVMSQHTYFQNPLTHAVEWSERPEIVPIATGKSFPVTVPPYSVRFLRIPSAAHPALTPLAKPAQNVVVSMPVLHLIAPTEEYADTPVTLCLTAKQSEGGRPYAAPLPPAALSVTGPAHLSRDTVRMAEDVGSFLLTPTGEGDATVTTNVSGATATTTIHFKPSIPRPVVLWGFDSKNLADPKAITSSFKLTADESVRANHTVARIDLGEPAPHQDKRAAIVLSAFPPADRLKRENIRGVFFDLQRGTSLHSADPDAKVLIVMQSTANYWMVLGSFPIAGKGGDWETLTYNVTDPHLIAAMPEAFNIWLALDSNKPVTGRFYLDNVGLMVR